MRFLVVAAGSAAAIIGLSVLPSHAADVTPPAPLAEYDEPEPIIPIEPAPVLLEAVPPAPVESEPAYVYGGYNYCWYEGGVARPRLVRLQLWPVDQGRLVGRSGGLE
jgi:hypothetical protein